MSILHGLITTSSLSLMLNRQIFFYTLSKSLAYCSFQSLLHIPQAMDTTSTAASAASISLNSGVEPSFKLPGQPNVIQTYKGVVKGMVSLMLRLSHEGLTPALTQELEGAACALVGLLVIACHCKMSHPSG